MEEWDKVRIQRIIDEASNRNAHLVWWDNVLLQYHTDAISAIRQLVRIEQLFKTNPHWTIEELRETS